MNDSQLIKMRIKATGQVLDLVPSVARAMFHGGTAELVDVEDAERMRPPAGAETASVEPRAERAVARAQAPPKKKAKPRK